MATEDLSSGGRSQATPAVPKRMVHFQACASEPESKKVSLGQRLLGRGLAVPFNYAELYRDPEAARRGEFDPDELLAKSTCASNGGEDES
jgi:hypothetical protein